MKGMSIHCGSVHVWYYIYTGVFLGYLTPYNRSISTHANVRWEPRTHHGFGAIARLIKDEY